jgi:hypothetical protein
MSAGANSRHQAAESRNSACDMSGGYLMRFHTTVDIPPIVDVSEYFSSSPAMVSDRFCSGPSQLGNVLLSSLKMMKPSVTTYVPKCVKLPVTIALFSSVVPVSRFSDANLGSLAA